MITDLETLYLRAHLKDYTCDLMSEDHRQGCRQGPIDYMKIAVAEARTHHTDSDLVRYRVIQLHAFDLQRLPNCATYGGLNVSRHQQSSSSFLTKVGTARTRLYIPTKGEASSQHSLMAK
tara:strand:+ start:9901 stop:10260 length:360 start_codon:yes stop_codon:yes gene_type:complete